MSEKEQSAAASEGARGATIGVPNPGFGAVVPGVLRGRLHGLLSRAFHAPAPHNVPVAIVGQQAASTATGQMNERAPDSFDVTAVDTPEAAREAITDREVIAAYDPTTRELFTAGANGKALQQVLLLSTRPATSRVSRPR